MNTGRFTSERVAEMNRARAIGFDEQWMPEPMSGCWLWFGGHDEKGYGRVNQDGREPAHRRSWRRNKGPIPNGLWVLHRCDNPACINPDHLFLGTRQDNVDDMMKKGRNPDQAGAKNGNARLSPAQVLNIRADTRPQTVVAEEYEISPAHVYRIRTRKAWSNLQ